MFTIWRNSYGLERLEVIGGLLIFIALFWLYINNPDPSIQKFSMVYIVMILLSAVMYAGKSAPISGRHMQTVGFGKSTPMFFVALAVGAGMAYFLISATSFNLVPVGIVETLASQVVLVSIFAAVAEEIFFRSSLIPTLTENFRSDLMGISIGSLAFGVFHYSVYGGDPAMLSGAVLFSVMATVGNSVLKSTGFGYALHIVWNYLVVTGS